MTISVDIPVGHRHLCASKPSSADSGGGALSNIAKAVTMMNTSPDYAITKPGMPHPLPRKRDKPLRTYGRKCAPIPEPRGEPPFKKARSEPVDCPPPVADAKQDSAASSLDQEPASLSENQPSRSNPRSSILKYFKPLPAAAPQAKTTTQQETNPQPTTSSTSSSTTARRKPRILKIRASPLPPLDSSAAASSSPDEEEAERHSSSPNGKRKPLRDSTNSMLNSAKDDASLAKATRRRSRPTVQTTLNISSQAAFAECKTCNVVWNPLFPDDVKYHDKRHKMAMTRKNKTDDW